MSIPRFVTTACAKDLHYVKALVASIHYYYPAYPVVIITDADVPSRQSIQLSKSFSGIKVVEAQTITQRHGLPLTGLLTKLNLFFLDDLNQCLYFDADSILVGPLLKHINWQKDFVALDGYLLDISNPHNYKLFNRYSINLAELSVIDANFNVQLPLYFSSGHFFVRTKSFPREEIESKIALLNSDFSPHGPFRFGDQGFLNYVVNKYSTISLDVMSQQYAINGKSHSAQYPKISLAAIKNRVDTDKYIIHYTGPSRRYWPESHNFGFALKFFEELYYKQFSPSVYFFDQLDRARRVLKGRLKKRFNKMISRS